MNESEWYDLTHFADTERDVQEKWFLASTEAEKELLLGEPEDDGEWFV